MRRMPTDRRWRNRKWIQS